MALTPGGIYYPDATTGMSIAQITSDIANSIDGKITIPQIKSYKTDKVVGMSSNSSYASSGVSVTIAPRNAANKIIISANIPYNVESSNASFWTTINYVIRRNGTDIYTANAGFYEVLHPAGVTPAESSVISLSCFDSPGTTSDVTYTVYAKTSSSGVTLKMNYNDSPTLSTIIAMEVNV